MVVGGTMYGAKDSNYGLLPNDFSIDLTVKPLGSLLLDSMSTLIQHSSGS